LRDTDIPSTSTALLVNARDIASETQSVDLPDETVNTPTTPENKLKDLDVYKERLCKSKERNASLRKKLFQERGLWRKLLKVEYSRVMFHDK
jgi:hypothetical protein